MNIYEADSQSWWAIRKTILRQIRKKTDMGEDSTFEQEQLREHFTINLKNQSAPSYSIVMRHLRLLSRDWLKA